MVAHFLRVRTHTLMWLLNSSEASTTFGTAYTRRAAGTNDLFDEESPTYHLDYRCGFLEDTYLSRDTSNTITRYSYSPLPRTRRRAFPITGCSGNLFP
jgi:hypothetical protein